MEVKVSKCENGHYYDLNKYDTCPHCGAAEFAVKDTQKKFFGFFKKEAEKPVSKRPESLQFSKEPVERSEDLISVEVETSGVYSHLPSETDNAETQGVFSSVPNAEVSVGKQASAHDTDSADMTVGLYSAPADRKKTDGVTSTENASAESSCDVRTTGFFSHGNTAEKKTGSLFEQVQAATDDNDVKTMGFFASKKTDGDTAEKSVQQPPVGWLVCLSGKHTGRDFRLFAGKNSIGRGDGNAVSLSGEGGVSREKHAWVIFEPKKQEFFIKSGDESGLVYLNDENVFDVSPLRTGDILEIGDVRMVFVALCGESFNWNDYIVKE